MIQQVTKDMIIADLLKIDEEIAAILNISEEQVKVNIFRARQTVKQKYIEKLEKQLEQIPKSIREVWLE